MLHYDMKNNKMSIESKLSIYPLTSFLHKFLPVIFHNQHSSPSISHTHNEVLHPLNLALFSSFFACRGWSRVVTLICLTSAIFCEEICETDHICIETKYNPNFVVVVKICNVKLLRVLSFKVDLLPHTKKKNKHN